MVFSVARFCVTLSITNKEVNTELSIRGDYYWRYKHLSDLPKMKSCFQEVKNASYKHRSFKNYFQIWSDMLQFYNVRGDTEYAIIQSLKMEEEATKLNNQEGIAYAYLSLARSLAASKKEEEAVLLFRKALDSKAIRPMTRVMIHSEIVTTYQQLGKDREAIEELQMQLAVLNQQINAEPARASFYKDNLLELELSFCAAYNNLNDTTHLLKHLRKAKKYYTLDCFFSNYINYHAYWGAYYKLTRQWDICFREFDRALAHFDNTQPLSEMIVQRMKGEALVAAARDEDAAQLYKKLSMMGDSLNHDVMKLHQEAHQANYRIRTALLEQETLEK